MTGKTKGNESGRFVRYNSSVVRVNERPGVIESGSNTCRTIVGSLNKKKEREREREREKERTNERISLDPSEISASASERSRVDLNKKAKQLYHWEDQPGASEPRLNDLLPCGEEQRENGLRKRRGRIN